MNPRTFEIEENYENGFLAPRLTASCEAIISKAIYYKNRSQIPYSYELGTLDPHEPNDYIVLFELRWPDDESRCKPWTSILETRYKESKESKEEQHVQMIVIKMPIIKDKGKNAARRLRINVPVYVAKRTGKKLSDPGR